MKNKILFIVLFLVINLSLLLFLRSPYFKLQEITFYGLEKVSSEELITVLGVRKGNNMWKISLPGLKERALTIPRIAEAEIKRELPSTLAINIQEKKPVLFISYHDYYLELAADSMIIGLQDTYTGELPLVNGILWGKMDAGTHIPDRSRGEIIDEFARAYKYNPYLPIAEINVENPQQIVVYTREGMEVWLGNKTNLAKKIEVLRLIYNRNFLEEQNIQEGYLDLRIAETPVFRLFNQ